MPSLAIRLFGSPTIVVDGVEHRAGGLRQQAVLALLALRPGETVPVEHLVDGLWGDDPPPAALKTVRAYVSRLRAIVGEALTSSGRGYRLAVAPDHVDVLARAALVRQAREHLARGDAVAAGALVDREDAPGLDFALFGLPGLQPWRARLDEDALAWREIALVALLGAGRAEVAVGPLQQLVAEHPYREQLWAALMRALYATGRQAEALDAFQRARRLLGDELGVDPSEELRRLEIAILRQDVEMPRANALPRYRTSFVGRETDVERFRAALAPGHLVTIVGPGGVGKTRLVSEALGAGWSRDPLFVDLSPVRDDDVGAVSTLLASAIGAEPGPRPALEAVAAVLSGPGTLLVLDNCEQVARAAAAVADRLLSTCPALTLVATSRVRFHVDGEQVVRLQPLAGPSGGPSFHPQLVRVQPGVRLFLERARAVDPGFDLDDQLAGAARLVQRLDGMPLALEMAAARLRSMSLADLIDRLEQRIERLASARPAAADRHASLEATVAWSYDLLTPAERRVLRWSAVFHGGWSLAALHAVLGEDAALSHLDTLVAASLVELGVQGGVGRYRLLDTVRDVAWDRLVRDGEEQAARHAHAAWALELAGANEAELYSEGVELRRRVLDSERDNIAAAVAWAVEQELELAPALVASVAWWWAMHGSAHEARRRLEQALTIERGPTRTRARLLRRYGALLAHMEAAGDAVEHLHEAERLAATFDDVALLGAIRHNLGFAERVRGNFAAARDVLSTALPLWEQTGRIEALALSNGLLADIATNVGDFDEAVERYAESLQLMRRAGSRHGMVAVLHSQTDLSIHLGDHEHAGRLIAEALPIAVEIVDAFHIGVLHHAAGQVALAQGDAPLAAHELLVALEREWDEQHNLEVTLLTLDVSAQVALHTGPGDDAWRLVTAVDRLRSEFGIALRPADVELAAHIRAAARAAVGHRADATASRAITWAVPDVVRAARDLLLAASVLHPAGPTVSGTNPTDL